MIDCDPNRMVQLFTNLLENAIRFSKKGGSVGIHVRSVREFPRMPQAARTRMSRRTASYGCALIRISHSGAGIEDGNKEAVFHTFHQVQHGRTSHGGSPGLE